MNVGNLLFSRRVRQNHALEHATITILSGMVSDLNVSARSSADGFIIFGNVDLGVLRKAMDGGNPEAKTVLAMLHLQGTSIRRFDPGFSPRG